MMQEHKNSHLSHGAYQLLGALAALIGLGASVVAGLFFWLGLQHTESDPGVRNALLAGCVLMTTAQIGAFGAAGLLPVTLNWLRWQLLGMGLVLFLFEVTLVGVTQLTLAQSADTAAAGVTARIAELERAIEARRATAQSQRTLAEAQTQAQAITAAARTLRLVAEAESGIEPLAAELARLQAARAPTLSTVLGDERAAWFVVTRSALIALTGLVAMSAAGRLFRAARECCPALPAPMAAPNLRPAAPAPARVPAPAVRWTRTVPSVPGRVLAAAAAPLAMVAGVQPVAAEPAPVPSVPEPVTSSAPGASTLLVRVAAPVQAVAPAVPAPVRESVPVPQVQQAQPNGEGVPADLSGDARFLEVRDLVRRGTLRLAVRDIKHAARCGTDTARRYRAALIGEGQA